MFSRASAAVRHLALDDVSADRVPVAPLGGGAFVREPLSPVSINHVDARAD
jgi:hypothetical protein